MNENDVRSCNKANMRLWVAGLRSGIFKRGVGSLKYMEEGIPKFCCLGVVCEIAMLQGVSLTVERSGSNFRFNQLYVGYLPLAIREWLGIRNEDPVVGLLGDKPIHAVAANDSLDLRFDRIADMLVEYYRLDEPDEPAATEPGSDCH